MYPEPKDISDVLTWLVSSISFSLEQVCFFILFTYQEKRVSVETKATEGNAILKSICSWRNGNISEMESSLLEPPTDEAHYSFNASAFLESESELLCKEHLRFKWNRIPSVGVFSCSYL